MSDPRGNSVYNGEKICSSQLFESVKPVCIELSRETLNPSQSNESKIVSLLTAIETQMDTLYREYLRRSSLFKLSPGVADYVFFPISNLLKQPSLSAPATQHVLGIIAFLAQHCWSFDVNESLFDQLLPLVLFLTGGDMKKEPYTIAKESLQFQSTALAALSNLISPLDKAYFSSGKRLHYLSNAMLLAFSVIKSTSAGVQEGIQVLGDAFKLVTVCLKVLSTSQKAMVVPGLMSTITHFATSNSGHNYKLQVQVLHILTEVVRSSFNDKELGAELVVPDQEQSLSDLNESVDWDDDEKTVDESIGEFTIVEKDERTTLWLRATSKQLKIMLVLFFKSVILSTKNRDRLKSKPEVFDSVVHFITEVLTNCFVTLYSEVTPMLLDIGSILIYASSFDEQDTIPKINHLVSLMKESLGTGQSSELESNSKSKLKSKAYYDIVRFKLSSLIDNKLSLVIFSTDEEKIEINITAIKLHFKMLMELSIVQDPEFAELSNLKKKCLSLLIQFSIDHIKFENSKKKPPKFTTGESLQVSSSDSNQLDGIELPGHIHAGSVKKVETSRLREENSSYLHGLQLISRRWDNPIFDVEEKSTQVPIDFKSRFLEKTLSHLVEFLSDLKDGSGSLSLLESIFEESLSEEILSNGVALWFASTYAGKIFQENKFLDSSEFLDLGGDDAMDDVSNEVTESAYLILMKAEELLADSANRETEDTRATSTFNATTTTDLAYVSALHGIGSVVGCLSLDRFRTDVLMDHLLPILQALTLTNRPQIQLSAQSTLKRILDTYYGGSMARMIVDNSDYLIDAISLQMAVASNLTPSLPGILMIIIKVAGIQLLEANQLTDILSDIFVILDSYHHYNRLAESLFIVFEVLVEQIQKSYIVQEGARIQDLRNNDSQFHPWGMTNKEQLAAFIENMKVDPYTEYDTNTEYFTRKGDKPFSEMADSDDDDAEEDEDQEMNDAAPEKEEWTSPIPKSTYEVLKRIFNYGMTLVSQPSYSLKSQILKTLRSVYPLLCTDYKRVLPIVTVHWPTLIALSTGSDSLTMTPIVTEHFPREKILVTVETLAFLTEILNQDSTRKEYFFSRKFMETVDFILKHSPLAKATQRQNKSAKDKDSDSRALAVSENAIYMFRMYPQLKTSLITFLVTGVQNYGKTVPDMTRYNVIKLCYSLSIPTTLHLSRDTLCIIEVLRRSC